MKKILFILSVIAIICWSTIYGLGYAPENFYQHQIGEKIDSFNGVYVYYNGPVSNVTSRNTTKDGYNLGLRYQCVEFVKRYYYEYFKHKMPNSYGHAKDFFQNGLKDGAMNKDRNLRQYTNPSATRPALNDLLIWSGYAGNPYGHVAIVSKVGEDFIEIIQQNGGPMAPTRMKFDLKYENKLWYIQGSNILGFLRK